MEDNVTEVKFPPESEMRLEFKVPRPRFTVTREVVECGETKLVLTRAYSGVWWIMVPDPNYGGLKCDPRRPPQDYESREAARRVAMQEVVIREEERLAEITLRQNIADAQLARTA